jgi:hypothetical protein
MATLSREIALYIDGDKSGGLDAVLDGTNSTPPNYPTALMAGDKCPLKVYFRQKATDNTASTYLDLPAGSTLVVAGRTTSGNVLFASTGFAASGAGTEASCYVGTIDLATAEIEAALAATPYGSAISIYIDIEVRNAGNTERLTFRGYAQLYKQVYDGSSSATSIAFGTMTAPDGGVWQIGVTDDGQPTFTKVA